MGLSLGVISTDKKLKYYRTCPRFYSVTTNTRHHPLGDMEFMYGSQFEFAKRLPINDVTLGFNKSARPYPFHNNF